MVLERNVWLVASLQRQAMTNLSFLLTHSHSEHVDEDRGSRRRCPFDLNGASRHTKKEKRPAIRADAQRPAAPIFTGMPTSLG